MSDARLLSDDELLAELAASFPVEAVEPDAAQLHRLSLEVDQLRQHTAPAAPTAAARPRRWSLPRRLSPVVLAGAVVGVVGAGTGISFAVGTPIPAAVRSIARSIGLDKPTTPTTVPAPTTPSASGAPTTVRQAESTLRQALAQSDPPRSVISRDGTVLAHRLVRLGGSPAAGSVGTTADGQHLLNEACRQLVGSAQTGTNSTSTYAGRNATTFPGCGPVGIWHYPSGPIGSSPTVPTTTRTTELPSAAHPGAGTHGGPVKAPVGRSSGSGSRPGEAPTGGVAPTGGSSRTTRSSTTTPDTTPSTFPGHSSGGSPGGGSPGAGSGPSTSSGRSSDPQTHGETTNPRSAPPPRN